MESFLSEAIFFQIIMYQWVNCHSVHFSNPYIQYFTCNFSNFESRHSWWRWCSIDSIIFQLPGALIAYLIECSLFSQAWYPDLFTWTFITDALATIAAVVSSRQHSKSLVTNHTSIDLCLEGKDWTSFILCHRSTQFLHLTFSAWKHGNEKFNHKKTKWVCGN